METLRVLVADDEPWMRAGAARVLQTLVVKLPEGDGREVRFEADEAESGEAALQKILARAPDILLLDHKLPGMSGLDLLEQLKTAAPDVLTVMITAYATLDTAVVATRRGAFEFLAKPFTPDELRSVMQKACKQVALLRLARQHAEEKRRIRFEFVSVLSHELKAPLAAIEGYLFALHDRSLGPALDPYSPMIERSIVRLQGMRKLVVDLLDMTRIESGQRKRELERLDVVEVARSAVEAVRSDAEARHIALELHAPGPVPTLADRAELELVLSNLLTNAVKYNRDGGRADLFLEARDGRVVIRAVDTGIGMAPEEVRRLFKEFVRIKNEKTRLIPGSGLGLSTVRKVALLYEGDAVVASEPDVGTTVEVVLGAALPA